MREADAKRSEYPDRWSKDLVGPSSAGTTSGFCIGVAEYHVQNFGEPQVHQDQEAIYVLSGDGEMMVGNEVLTIEPGSAVYVPPETRHATRRTGPASVKVLYAHGAI